MRQLRSVTVTPDNLRVAENATLILPLHQELDVARESAHDLVPDQAVPDHAAAAAGEQGVFGKAQRRHRAAAEALLGHEMQTFVAALARRVPGDVLAEQADRIDGRARVLARHRGHQFLLAVARHAGDADDLARFDLEIEAGDLTVHDGRLWHRVQQSPFEGERSRRRVMYIPIITGAYQPKTVDSPTPFYHKLGQLKQKLSA